MNNKQCFPSNIFLLYSLYRCECLPTRWKGCIPNWHERYYADFTRSYDGNYFWDAILHQISRGCGRTWILKRYLICEERSHNIDTSVVMVLSNGVSLKLRTGPLTHTFIKGVELNSLIPFQCIGSVNIYLSKSVSWQPLPSDEVFHYIYVLYGQDGKCWHNWIISVHR